MKSSSATLPRLVEEVGDAGGALTFIRDGCEHEVPFAALRDGMHAIASGLRGRGLRVGERVVLAFADPCAFVHAFFGASCAGLVPVPVYPPFPLADLDAYVAGLRRTMHAAGACTIVCEAWMQEVFARIGDDVSVLDGEDLARAAGDGAMADVRAHDVAFLQFTSGSTAAPKGAIVTHAALLANAHAIADHLEDGHEERDRVVSWLPMYHDMGLIGMLVVPLVRQVPAWYLSPLDFLRRPAIWCDVMHAVGGTITFAPTFAYSLVAKRATDEQIAGWDLSRWRVAGCGAEPIRPEALNAFAERLAPAGFAAEAFLPCYGLAEATLAVTLAPRRRGLRTLQAPGELAQEVVGCGPPVAGVELAIVDRRGRRLSEREEGELLVRGPSVVPGYRGDPEATAATFRDGWLHTGDLGFLDGGELFVTGRKKDLIVTRGRNYHPQDVEWATADVEGVRTGNAVAFSYRGSGDGERTIVVAERRGTDDAGRIAAEITARVRSQVGLAVDEVVVVERGELPKTSSGKLRRAATRARYLSGAWGAAPRHGAHSGGDAG